MLLFSTWVLMAFLSLLSSPVAGEELFEVRMWPEWPVVEAGKDLWINCSTNCTSPQGGGIETRNIKMTTMREGTHWKAFHLSNFSENTNIFCYFICSDIQKRKSVSVIVYRPPQQVTLSLQPSWVIVGKNFTLTCHVPNVVPLENLTLTLLQGTEKLYRQTFVTVPTALQDAWLTLNVTARREDSKSNFSCHAELDLRPHREQLFSATSEPKMLEIFEPSWNNQMLVTIIITILLLLVFVISVCLCFAYGQHWRQHRTGGYGVLAAWRNYRIRGL
ncbi:intercellular adhesion molecule 2 isoform X2 [Phascolarctos cinereus]|uniref:Intercellular adhesion molecule 2 isoform X1 n=1 Tax=Phascolarctos cinereus TaxID=38626 RepID=A0A6P5LP48_PHACI|nr:intercellular adhesion molecule 2 isoform X1 [Phascolarctos cinereus]